MEKTISQLEQELRQQLEHERLERETYFKLFGWKPLRTEEDVANVPRDEILICRGRDAELPYYCVDALAKDATAEEMEQFFVDYDCYALVSLSPFPSMILESVEDETPAH
jgi:hypothetical protein